MIRRAESLHQVLLKVTGGILAVWTGTLNAQDIFEWQRLTDSYYAQQHLDQQRELLFYTLPLWAMAFNLLAAAILLLVWRQQRSVPQFNWLIGVSLTANGYLLGALGNGLVEPVLIDSLISAWLYFLSRILFNRPGPVLQRWLNALPILALVMFGVANMVQAPRLHGAVTALYCLFLLLMSSHQIGLRLRRPLTAKLSLVFGVWFIAVLGVIDSIIVIVDFRLAAHPDMLLQLVPVGQIGGVLAALYFLVARHAQNQQQLAVLNASLDHRVHDAEAELEDRYRMLTRDALDAAAMRERKTIYQSIHEDLSDKLLQLIYAARSPETADLARSALAELRDSRKLHPDQERPLADILADARNEIQTRCDQAHIALLWNMEESIATCQLQARQESALTRTLREALSNLLKHAQASQVTMEFALTASREVVYCVSDNGVGIKPDHRAGRGLVNMRNRMKELGGSVCVEQGTPGTRLIFVLPLVREET